MIRRALFLVAALGLASCSRTSGVAVLEVRPVRLEDNAVLVDVDVAGFEQSGAEVGPYCVSVHFLPAFYDPAVAPPATVYFAQMDTVEQCLPGNNGMRDGDRRTFRFVSTKKDLPGGFVRAQTKVAREIETMDVALPPRRPQ
jgi:hypothetical protein